MISFVANAYNVHNTVKKKIIYDNDKLIVKAELLVDNIYERNINLFINVMSITLSKMNVCYYIIIYL